MITSKFYIHNFILGSQCFTLHWKVHLTISYVRIWNVSKLLLLFASALIAATRILAGEHSFATVSGLEQYSDVDLIIMHPNYDTVTLENDIVLMRVLYTTQKITTLVA